MDIGSGSGYPSSSLSNFAPHPFVFHGVEINSMEGFLQSMKFKDKEIQKHVCTLVGRAAKFKGKHKKWFKEQKLYWNGIEFDRHGQAYQNLLDQAFDALSMNDSFKRALLATNNAVLSHSMGKNDKSKTVLTEQEFCSRLMKIRKKLQMGD